ncbi:MAG: zinc-dependent alcohol dehydrogenase family protein [Kiloniellales bacterium]|nr:zinc-dependent alcohol dehydrogenase family protein [Kiloniellales bacterium]
MESKAVFLLGHGQPDRVCECREVAAPGAPGAGEVLVDIKASAINPADLLIIEGRYPGPETLPAQIGIEGAGVVAAVGPDVADLRPGDYVISLGRANWCEKVLGPASQFIKLPKELSFQDAAMLKANPPSAHLMLTQYVDLEAGDWVIQNAANSAVGRHLIRLAGKRGIKTVNVVRRDALVPELGEIGADLVLVDGEDLAERVRAEIGAEARLPLAIDAIGGLACQRLADCLSDGGTVVNYGFLSGEPCMITPYQTIIHDITLKGFWLVGFMRSASREEITALYAAMARHFIDGTFSVPVEAEYPLTEAKAALAHANRESRGGKILFRMG